MVLPRPFRRGEGWGEGAASVVYPAVPSVTKVNTMRLVSTLFSVAVAVLVTG